MRFRGLLAFVGVLAAVLTITPVAVGAPASGVPWPPWQFVRVAGTGDSGNGGNGGDGGPATKATLGAKLLVAVGPDGLYIADQDRAVLRRVGKDGVIDTVAKLTADNKPEYLAAGPDDTVYLANALGIWRVGKDGKTTQLLGGGHDYPARSGVAGDTVLVKPGGLAVDGHGNVYFSNVAYPNGVYRRDANGTLTLVTSRFNHDRPFTVDRQGRVYVAEDARIFRYDADGAPDWGTTVHAYDDLADNAVSMLATDAAGTLYVGTDDNPLLRLDEHGNATSVSPPVDPARLAVGPDGVVYGLGDNRVDKVVRAEPTASASPGRSRWPDDAPGTVHTVATAVQLAAAVDNYVFKFVVGPGGTAYVEGAKTVVDVHPDGAVSEEKPAEQTEAVDANGYRYEMGQDLLFRTGPGTNWTSLKVSLPGEYAVTGMVLGPNGDPYVIISDDLDHITSTGATEELFHGDDLITEDQVAVATDGTVYVLQQRPEQRLLRIKDHRQEPVPLKDKLAIRGIAVVDDALFVVDEDKGILRIDADGTSQTVLADDEWSQSGNVVNIEPGPGGDLYFVGMNSDNKDQLLVLVRPAQIPADTHFPWKWVLIGGAVLVVALAWFFLRRRRARGSDEPG